MLQGNGEWVIPFWYKQGSALQSLSNNVIVKISIISYTHIKPQ